MAERRPQFWFPQIPQNSSVSLHSTVVVKTVNQVLVLFSDESGYIYQIPICDEGASLGILSSSSFCTKDILQFFDKEVKPPFYILGTVTHNEAVAQSWKDFGLNLFDLPWCKEKKIFHYLPILSLPDMLKAVIHKRYEYNDTHVQDAIDDIKWAKCHEWIRKIQRCFGHGKRDEMQFCGLDSAKDDIQKNIIKKDDAQKQLPCQKCHVNNALENAYKNIATENKFKQIRKVANLDCQGYHLAPLSSIPLDITARYKRVVILEDDENMRNHIETIIKERYGKGIVQKANVKESQKKWCFCGDDGTEIKLRDKNCNEWETLVCLDLELGQKKKNHDGPSGLWFLYNTALHHPFVSRLVITGYRTGDEKSFNAGTCGFLLKPFTEKELNVAIETSSPFRVLWICPDTVRADWKQWASKVNDEANYDWISDRLGSWLSQFHIRLDDIPVCDKSRIPEYSIIIMDYYGVEPKCDTCIPASTNTQDKLINDYLKITSSNPSANIIIILPMRDDIFQPKEVLHSVGRIIRDGQDVILHKPMWICSDDPKVESLGQTIKTTLERRPLFDVKYVIYTPIMGLVWPKAEKFIEQQAISSDKRPGKALDHVDGWSPVGVLMGETWGFTASFKDILDDPRLGLELSEQLDKERKKHKRRWEKIPNEISSNELVNKFLSYLLQPGNKVASYLTIERWLRAVLDRHISEVPGRRSLTESLAHLFGGETRYEFSTRGGWYDSSGTFVQDAPLIIEFCGRKGIVAREAIEDVVVDYLKSVGGEQEVLFQEVPIRGFLR